MRRRNSARIALTVLALPAGLLATEVLVRALGLAPAPLPVRQGGLLRSVDDALLLFENLPGAAQRMEYRERAGGPARVVELRVNAQGFRGPEARVPKPAGVVRIACVGDSHTFGDGVGEEETYPAHLQRILDVERDARGDPVPTEVLNCGVNGYDTLQEVLGMERTVLAHEPDVVVLQYYVNDTAARNLASDEPGPRDRLLEWTTPRRTGAIARLRSISRAFDLVCDGVWRWRGLSQYSSLRTKLYSDSSPGWIRVQDALRRARDELARRRIRFGVALYPFLLREGDRLTSHEAFEIVKEFCRREGIACLDTEPAFLAFDVEELRVSTLDYHGNGRANEIFARAVAAWLASQGWIERLR